MCCSLHCVTSSANISSETWIDDNNWNYRVLKYVIKCLFFSGYRCHVCAKPMHKECIALLAKCGSPSLPELPPRPSLHQRMSSISLMETNNNAATSTATTASIVAANADYVNTNIEEHSWWDIFSSFATHKGFSSPLWSRVATFHFHLFFMLCQRD